MKLGRIAVSGPDGAIPRLVVAQPERQRVSDPPLRRGFSAFLEHIRAMTRRMGQTFSEELWQRST